MMTVGLELLSAAAHPPPWPTFACACSLLATLGGQDHWPHSENKQIQRSSDLSKIRKQISRRNSEGRGVSRLGHGPMSRVLLSHSPAHPKTCPVKEQDLLQQSWSPHPLPAPISSSISLTCLSCYLSSHSPWGKAGVARGWPGSSFQSFLHRPGTSKVGMSFAAVWLQCLAQALAHDWAL